MICDHINPNYLRIKMMIVQSLFLLVLIQNCQILYGKYLLVQISDKKLDITKLEAEEKPYIPIRDNLPGIGQPKVQIRSRARQIRSRDDRQPKVHIKSRDHRIIGGKEITPHSEPWLALLCYSDVPEMW